MEEKLVNILKGIVESNRNSIKTEIKEETRLREDLGLDSFQLAELTVHIEEEFGVDIFEDGLVSTVGEIKEKLSNE